MRSNRASNSAATSRVIDASGVWHLGAWHESDGIADAQLGPLAYRVVLECKSTPAHSKPSRPKGGGVVSKPDVAEAAKWIPIFDADFAVLIGPDSLSLTEGIDYAVLLGHVR